MQFYQYLKLIRIHQPAGIFLLLWPCLWGVALARGTGNLTFIAILILGSVLMRSIGCIINDIVDIDFDKNVARTKNRPLANGGVSIKEAFGLLIVLSLMAICILPYFNTTAFTIAVVSIFLVILYPFMKRITFWPQLFLGVTFNIGSLLAYAQIIGTIEMPVMLLYIAGICWTLGYDTIYGYQDINDDLKIGVKSSAIAIGSSPARTLAFFYFSMILLIAVSTALIDASHWTLILLVPPIFLLAWQVYTLDITSPKNCLIRFKSNIYVGLLIFGALCVA